MTLIDKAEAKAALKAWLERHNYPVNPTLFQALDALPARGVGVPTDEPEAGEIRALIVNAKWKPCVHGGGWWVAQDADGCPVLLAPDGFAALAPTDAPDLTDPVTVHANMLRGTIAKPTVEQITHLYGREAFQPMIDAAVAKALERACLAVSEHADWPEDEHGRTEQVGMFARVINAILALAPTTAADPGDDVSPASAPVTTPPTGAAAAAVAPTDAAQDDDPECTDCGGTGITYQTERVCACQSTDAALTKRAGEMVEQLGMFVNPQWSTGAPAYVCTAARDLLTALLTANATLRAERDRYLRHLTAGAESLNAYKARAEAAEAERDALRAERDALAERDKENSRLAEDNAQGLREAEAEVEKLRGALMVARAHVANNAEGWSVSRGAARDDLTIVDAALTETATTEADNG